MHEIEGGSVGQDCEHRVVSPPGVEEKVEGGSFSPQASDAAPAFYNETVLSRCKPGFVATNTAVVVTVGIFCAVGAFMMGVGAVMLWPVVDMNHMNHVPERASEVSVIISGISETPSFLAPMESSGFVLSEAQADRPAFESVYIASAETVSNHIIQLVEYIEPSVAAISVVATHVLPVGPFSLPGGRGLAGSSGSGILFYEDDERVFIATNAHVIENATSVNVRVMQSGPVAARLVGQDVYEDIAVISILKADFAEAGLVEYSVARFGNSDEMRVGQMVLAVGNALGGGNTATNGVISARETQILVDGREYTVLQTNAAINPGNSGGPLVNMSGEVVGINTAKVAAAYNVEGMGYSITANKAIPVIEAIMSRVAANTPYFGIEGRDISSEIAEMYGLPEMGVFVNHVFAGSPAERAGILRGDIIASFDATPVLSMETFQEMIRLRSVGEHVWVRIIRGGVEQLDVEVVLDRLVDTSF